MTAKKKPELKKSEVSLSDLVSPHVLEETNKVIVKRIQQEIDKIDFKLLIDDAIEHISIEKMIDSKVKKLLNDYVECNYCDDFMYDNDLQRIVENSISKYIKNNPEVVEKEVKNNKKINSKIKEFIVDLVTDNDYVCDELYKLVTESIKSNINISFKK